MTAIDPRFDTMYPDDRMNPEPAARPRPSLQQAARRDRGRPGSSATRARLLSVTLAAAIAAVPGAAGAQQPAAQPPAARVDSADARATGREYTRRFFAGDLAALWSRFTPEMRQAMKDDSSSLRAFHGQVTGQLGAEVELVREEARDAGGGRVHYARTIRFERGGAQRFVVNWVTAADGAIAGFVIRPAPEPAPTPHLEYVTKASLQLPFEGEWYVFWGGRTPEQNYHVVSRSQRFAYDMLVMRDGKSHVNDGRALTDYHCFGQPILAPAAGRVAKVVDGLPDQPIGSADARNPAGNHVVIDHGGGEFSTLAHLRQGSVTVHEGDPIRAGARVGACGNSGNTSEPHLHYQLQDAADMLASGTLGLPAQFVGYLADGQPVARGEPLRGQRVRRAPR